MVNNRVILKKQYINEYNRNANCLKISFKIVDNLQSFKDKLSILGTNYTNLEDNLIAIERPIVLMNNSGYSVEIISDREIVIKSESIFKDSSYAEIDTSNLTVYSLYKLFYLTYSSKIKIGNLKLKSNEDNIDAINTFNLCMYAMNIDFTDTSICNISDMTRMFSECYNIEELDLTPIKTDRLTKMVGTFADCSELRIIKAPNIKSSLWDNELDIRSAFIGSHNLEHIDLSGLEYKQIYSLGTSGLRPKDKCTLILKDVTLKYDKYLDKWI